MLVGEAVVARLRQVLPPGCCPDGVAPFLDVEVTAVKLNIGSPCGGGGDIFAPWPGSEAHVRQWFVLANRRAVGIEEDPTAERRCLIVEFAE
jgi:hypothetical protein